MEDNVVITLNAQSEAANVRLHAIRYNALFKVIYVTIQKTGWRRKHVAYSRGNLEAFQGLPRTPSGTWMTLSFEFGFQKHCWEHGKWKRRKYITTSLHLGAQHDTRQQNKPRKVHGALKCIEEPSLLEKREEAFVSTLGRRTRIVVPQ
ncbi:hypothetical protein J3458_020580 [Metarhizium acridum]|uniref:uncharacterized protein n=1 Tax=Metarhizium acridum TaxID=92637 RepID=UPI001C6BAF51|nr:hypothetical protein J3458_020580 [Metarhizium acridum]